VTAALNDWLVYEPGEKGASLTQAQFERLKAEMEGWREGQILRRR